MKKKVETDFLFARPSFASGIVRIFDLWGNFDAYNYSFSEEDADSKAIASDWIMVGQDIQEAIDRESKLQSV